MAASRDNYSNLSSFFREEYEALNGFVRSRLGNAADQEAEDIVQDVALRLFSRADDIGRINNIAGYVYHAIRNRIVDTHRIRKKRVDGEEALEARWAEFAELFYSGGENPFPEDMVRRLRQAIATIRPEYRVVILAIDFEGITYRELAEELGIPPGTLMSRRHRALAELTKKLKPS